MGTNEEVSISNHHLFSRDLKSEIGHFDQKRFSVTLIKPEIFLVTKKYLGVPMYASVKDNFLSFEAFMQ